MIVLGLVSIALFLWWVTSGEISDPPQEDRIDASRIFPQTEERIRDWHTRERREMLARRQRRD
jgi:nitrogen fixation-related uncharacterized protein